MAAADLYKVKHVEPVLKSSDVLARIFTLAPGDTIPWHYHQHCADHFFVLEGVLSISTREPALTRKLSVGQSHKIAPGTAHLVVNGGDHDCRFFLLQGVGTYDWNPAE